MKRTIAAVVLAGILCAAQAFAAAEHKTGVVDFQRAVSETKEGAAARSALLKRSEQLNDELKVIQGEFEKLKGDLEKNGSTMTPEARNEKELQLQQKGRDFQKRQRDAQEEMKQTEADLIQKLVGKLSLLMGKIGEDEGYEIIVEQSAGVRFYSKKVDVTPELIKKADEAYSK